MDYIEVPVLVRLDLPVADRLGFYLQGGPAFGWQIDCSVEVEAAGGEASPGLDCDELLGGGLEDTLRDYEVGGVGGGGLELVVLPGRGAVTLDARLTRGLTRLTDDEAGTDVKNQSFSLMIGYTLNPSMGGIRR